MDKRFDLSVSNYGTVKQMSYDMAILPWGATEPHNLHLPYLTDCILSQCIALDAAELAHSRHGVAAMVLPPVSMGSQNPGQRELPFCIHYRYETQKAILEDMVVSLEHQGLSKLLIVNGHGGNVFKNMVRDLAVGHPGFIVAASEWFKMAPAKDFFDSPGDHADELETSVMMHYHPELAILAEAGYGRSRGFAQEALEAGAVWLPRNWGIATEDTGIGNPHAATAEKGKAFAKAVAERYALFIADFVRAASEEDLYESAT